MVNYSGIPNNSKTNNMGQTAVDYIFKKLDVLFTLTPQTKVTGTKEEWENLYKQAKQIEKEQIVKAFNEGMLNSVDYFGNGFDEAEQYYNEKYNQ
jgi:hypothetical protein